MNEKDLHPESMSQLPFLYVNDDVLWNKIWYQDFPKDLKEKRDTVYLPNFFDVETIFIPTNRGYKKERKYLTPNENYYIVDKDIRDGAFLALYSFLKKFNRPHRDLYLHIPNHPEIEPMEDYECLNLYYKEPVLPALSEDGNMIKVIFPPELYNKIYQYCFGHKFMGHSTDFAINFSFGCFCGFTLQY